jgi:tetratricopeptide (TPR) repeat protein
MNVPRVLLVVLISFCLSLPVMAADPSDQFKAAGTLYSKSVDLANAGNYSGALEQSDEALAMNVTSLIPLIQANRAGILVMLGRFNEANAAADGALSAEGNLTSVHSIAWFNKGNALRSLGRLEEAKTAYAKAYALDKSLVPPDLSQATIIPTTPAKSPVGWITAPIAITLVTLFVGLRYRRRK